MSREKVNQKIQFNEEMLRKALDMEGIKIIDAYEEQLLFNSQQDAVLFVDIQHYGYVCYVNKDGEERNVRVSKTPKGVITYIQRYGHYSNHIQWDNK